MSSRTVTTDLRVESARALAETLSAGDCYAYVADASSYQGSLPPDVVGDTYETDARPYQQAVAGKRVTSADVTLAVRNVPWQAGRVYDAYDDQADLSQLDYYVVVNAGAFSHVWKCLDNNGGANTPATQEPVFADLSADDELYELADGYRWRYMYSCNSSVVAKFATTDWFPLGSNAQVEAAAVDGAIDKIVVEDGGAGYSNYLTGVLSAADIQVGNATTYAVTANGQSSVVDGYYTGCLMYVSAGVGAGQAREIVHYFSNGSGRYVVLRSPFSPAPTNTSEYEIYPEVRVASDGYQTANALARALVNASTNSVYRVEMLARGAGYRQHSATVVANSVVLVGRPAQLRSVYGPRGGHGSDPARELGATAVTVSVTLANSESNTIPTGVTFRRVGLIRAPLFTNVTLALSSSNGTFREGDDAYAVSYRAFSANGATTLGSSVVTCSGADGYFAAGDWVYMTSSDGTAHQLASVTYVNSTAIEVSPNALWACTTVAIAVANATLAGQVYGVPDGTHLVLDRASTAADVGALVVDYATGAVATVSSVARGGITSRTYDTFVGLTKLSVANTQGTPQYGETLALTGNGTALCAGYAQLTGNTATLLVSAVADSRADVGVAYVGQSSGATGAIVSAQAPEVDPSTGEVLFVENVGVVQRSPSTSEDLIVTVDF